MFLETTRAIRKKGNFIRKIKKNIFNNNIDLKINLNIPKQKTQIFDGLLFLLCISDFFIGPSNEHPYQTWFQLDQCFFFFFRKLKCKTLRTTMTTGDDGGHQMMTIRELKSSYTLHYIKLNYTFNNLEIHCSIYATYIPSFVGKLSWQLPVLNLQSHMLLVEHHTKM